MTQGPSSWVDDRLAQSVLQALPGEHESEDAGGTCPNCNRSLCPGRYGTEACWDARGLLVADVRRPGDDGEAWAVMRRTKK